MTPKGWRMWRLDQAVFAHAFGNKCRTRVHTQLEHSQESKPERTQEENSRETGTKKRRRTFLETRTKEREFALDMLLETGAECRHIQIRTIIWHRESLMHNYLGKSVVQCAEEIGTHGIVSQRTGTNNDEHIYMEIFHIIPSSTKLLDNMSVFSNVYVEGIKYFSALFRDCS